MRLAMEHAPSSQKSNAQRVRELHEQGLQLKGASSHGVNNCLIDAILLGLLDVGLVPGIASLSQQQRRHVCVLRAAISCTLSMARQPECIWMHTATRHTSWVSSYRRNGHKMLRCTFGSILVLITLTQTGEIMPCGALLFNLLQERR